MNELSYGYEGYEDYKAKLDNALGAAVENFVLIGYLLRVAKEDPTILADSEYETVQEMAKAEYGLEQSQVSRFISINERYGDGPELLPQYRGYGQSKLSEMLSLPAAVADEIPKEATREDIREIKREIAEENNITDIEVAIERAENPNIGIVKAFFKDWIAKNPEKYISLSMGGMYEELFEKCTLVARVPGEGKILMTEKDEEITLTNLRTNEKMQLKGNEADDIFWELVNRREDGKCIEDANPFTKSRWEEMTGETFPEEKKAAQKQEKSEKTENAPAHKLTTAPASEERPDPIETDEDAEAENVSEVPDNALNKPEVVEEAPETASETHEEISKEEIETTEESEPLPFPDEEPKEKAHIEESHEAQCRKMAKGILDVLDRFEKGAGTIEGNWSEIEWLADNIKGLVKKVKKELEG